MSKKSIGVSMVIAIDSSISMLVRDVRPNRLEVAKRSATVILRTVSSAGIPTLISVISFYRNSFPILDLTDNWEDVEKAINSIHASGKTTDLSMAIKEAFYIFKDSPPGYQRRLIVISDGDFNEGPGPEELELLVRSSSMRVDFLIINGGQKTRVNEASKLASASGGKVVTARSLEEAVKGAMLLAMSD